MQEQLIKQGLVLQISSPEALSAMVRSDSARWRKVINDAKIVAD